MEYNIDIEFYGLQGVFAPSISFDIYPCEAGKGK